MTGRAKGVAFGQARAYLATTPDIVATLLGLAPQGAGTKRVADMRAADMRAEPETAKNCHA